MSRVSLLTTETAPAPNGELLEKLAAHGADVHPLLRAIAHTRGCFRNFLRLPDALIRHSDLSPRFRELAVMRIAQQQGSEYEWKLHERYAIAAGISPSELQALSGGEAAALGEIDRLVIRFVDDALAGTLSDETFALVAKRIGEEDVVELVLVVGWWAGLVPFVNAALDVHLTDQ